MSRATEFGDVATDWAVGQMRALERRWPPGLMLVAMDGALHVVRISGWRPDHPLRDEQPAILATLGIPCDGGAW